MKLVPSSQETTNLHTLVYSNYSILSSELRRSSRICGLLTCEKSEQRKFKSQELVQILFHDVWYLVLSFPGKNGHHANVHKF